MPFGSVCARLYITGGRSGTAIAKHVGRSDAPTGCPTSPPDSARTIALERRSAEPGEALVTRSSPVERCVPRLMARSWTLRDGLDGGEHLGLGDLAARLDVSVRTATGRLSVGARRKLVRGADRRRIRGVQLGSCVGHGTKARIKMA